MKISSKLLGAAALSLVLAAPAYAGGSGHGHSMPPPVHGGGGGVVNTFHPVNVFHPVNNVRATASAKANAFQQQQQSINFAPVISNVASAAAVGSGWGLVAAVAVPIVLGLINQQPQMVVAPKTRIAYRDRYVPVPPCDADRDPKSPPPRVCYNHDRRVYESPGPTSMLPQYLAELDRQQSKTAEWKTAKSVRFVDGLPASPAQVASNH